MLPRHSSSSFEKPPKRAFATQAVYVTVIAAPGPVKPKERGLDRTRDWGPRNGGPGRAGRLLARVERCGDDSAPRHFPRPATSSVQALAQLPVPSHLLSPALAPSPPPQGPLAGHSLPWTPGPSVRRRPPQALSVHPPPPRPLVHRVNPSCPL